MGQYYKPILGEKTEEKFEIENWMYSRDYGSGLKLMEHSWMKNPFVRLFEQQLRNAPKNVVWAGDYADGENGEESENLYRMCGDDLKITPENNIEPSSDDEFIQIFEQELADYPFLVNHDKKVFVDKRNIVVDNDGWRIHPLPLLTVEGNGRGGGDFGGDDPNGLVGSWARDLISLEGEVPEGYEELTFDLVGN